jgi:uncharacterized membrane protein YfcA
MSSTVVVAPAKQTSHSAFWIAAATLIVIVAAATVFLPHSSDVVAGFNTRQIVIMEEIIFFAGLMSGLSGFGFSGIGGAWLLFLPPLLAIPLLQLLSMFNQTTSFLQILDDMPHSWEEFWAGTGPVMVGGLVGVPAGIWVLIHVPAKQLSTLFGTLLILYSIYSLLKPAALKLNGFGDRVSAAVVGVLGGAAGGFTAFPGSAVVVWTGLRNLPKGQTRALVQPFIIMAQIYALGILAWTHPSYFSHRYWLLFAITVPLALTGTFCGVAIYRRISDVNFRRVCFFLLAVSGASLLLKIYGPALVKLLV